GVAGRTKSDACGAHSASRCCMIRAFRLLVRHTNAQGGVFMSEITLIPRLKEALSEVRRVRSIAGTAMLAALNLVLNQFTIMVSQMLEIGFAFLTAACAAYLYGPWLAGLAGIVTDTIGYLFRPNGPYFPFFAIN